MDTQPYHEINQDSRVIEFLRGSMSMEEIKQFMDKANRHQEKWGFTLWAAELKHAHNLIGFIGLYFTATDWDGVPLKNK